VLAQAQILGSTACQPVLFGSLPKSAANVYFEEFLRCVEGVVGKLPTTTGWKPVLPGSRTRSRPWRNAI